MDYDDETFDVDISFFSSDQEHAAQWEFPEWGTYRVALRVREPFDVIGKDDSAVIIPFNITLLPAPIAVLPDDPEPPSFVIPESPSGTIGIVIVLLGVYVTKYITEKI